MLCDKHVQLDVFAHLKIATHKYETNSTSVLHIRFDLGYRERQRVPCLSIYFAPLRHKARYTFLFRLDLPVLQRVCGWHWACVCVCVWSAAFTGVSQLADCASVLVVVVAVAMLLLLLWYMFYVIAAKTRLATITSEFSPQTKPSICFKLLCVRLFVHVWGFCEV